MDIAQLRRSTPFSMPIRVLQFGQGNFLRGFVDWQIDIFNERCGANMGVVIVRPTSRSTAPLLDTQDGCFTTVLRGLTDQGELQCHMRCIQCVQRELDLAIHFADYLALAGNPDIRFVVSNTTEAGITVNDTDLIDDAPPQAFPAKLTRWLYERFVRLGGAHVAGVIVLPTELIEANGPALQLAVAHFARLWELPEAFHLWLVSSCCFCSTLVDRIVTGYPAKEVASIAVELGYRDSFLVAGEPYHLWAIQAPDWVARELPLQRAGLNVQWVHDLAPLRLRKVAILNGSHTLLAAVGPLAGLHTVRDAVNDPDVSAFLLSTLNREIIPALPLPQDDVSAYASEVLLRFRNPSIEHQLSAISLNMESKWLARLLPQLKRSYELKQCHPAGLVTGLAAALCGAGKGSSLLQAAMEGVPGLAPAVAGVRARIAAQGMRTVLRECNLPR